MYQYILITIISVSVSNTIVIDSIVLNNSTLRANPSEYNFCSWDDINNCKLICSSAESHLYEKAVEYKKNEVPYCYINGFKLIFSTPSFPNNKMTSYWFDADVTITEFELSCDIEYIESDAFATRAFKTLTHLILKKIGIRTLVTGMFNGLMALRELTLISENIQIIQPNLLEPISNTLERLTMISNSQNYMLSVNGLTGSKRMPVLTEVNFNKNNFANTITRYSFTGLAAVETLFLSNSKIDIIDDYTFDPVTQTIKFIDLNGNTLKSLPSNIFQNLLPNNNLLIRLDTNQWVCDCSSLPFQLVLKEYRDNFLHLTNLVCYQPLIFKNQPIHSIEFCNETNVTPSTVSFYSSITTDSGNSTIKSSTSISNYLNTSSTPTTTSYTQFVTETSSMANEIIKVQCKKGDDNLSAFLIDYDNDNDNDYINIKSKDASIKVIKITNDGDVWLMIDKLNNMNLSRLLWFGNNNGNSLSSYNYSNNDYDKNALNCERLYEKEMIILKGLSLNENYLFCILENFQTTTISPLNCIMQYIQPSVEFIDGFWIGKDSKIITIIFLMVFAVFCMCIGGIVSCYILKRNPQWMINDYDVGGKVNPSINSIKVTKN